MVYSKNIDDLRPDIRPNCRAFLAACESMGLDPMIVNTVRDAEKQAQFYKEGSAKTSVPSFHSCGVGLAFDICSKSKGYDDLDFFKSCGILGEEAGFEWGGLWTNFVDMPHFQWSGENHEFSSADILNGKVVPAMPKYTYSDSSSRYKYKDGIHFVYIPIPNFRIMKWDKSKRTTDVKNYFNLGFFGWNLDGSTNAGGNLCVDGKIIVDALTAPKWSNLYNKKLSTLIVTKDKAEIIKTDSLQGIQNLIYAVSGIPIIKGGKDVSFKNDVLTEGYDGSETYGTWHGFLSVKDNQVVYMAFQTKTYNCVATSEAFDKLKGYGFSDVIMVDGGGSFVLDYNGTNVAETPGNRRINNIGLY